MKEVHLSIHDGKSRTPARLGKDEGKYSFRRWEADFTLPAKGAQIIKVRCTNANGQTQPEQPNWNGSGYMRSVIEATPVEVV